MISDVLHDAIMQIEDYQNNKLYADWYDDDTVNNTNTVKFVMDAQRFMFDSASPDEWTDERIDKLTPSDKQRVVHILELRDKTDSFLKEINELVKKYDLPEYLLLEPTT